MKVQDRPMGSVESRKLVDEDHPGQLHHINDDHGYSPVTPSSSGAPNGCYAGFMRCLGGFVGCLGMIPCCCCSAPYKFVQQGFVGLVSEYGRFTRIAEPGLVYVNPVTDALISVDTRVRVQPLPTQTILTHDNVSVRVDSVLYWKVVDPATSVFRVDGVEHALIERAQTTMRDVCSVRDLQDMLTHREQMAEEIKEIIDKTARSWGIEIESILIKDIIMGAELQEHLSAAAVAKRQGASKVITAQAEVESAKLMREASDIMSTPAAMQFRYLETLQKMASQAQTRVIFVPMSNNAGGGIDGQALKAGLVDNLMS